MPEHTSKVALITGGARRIGAQIAMKLHSVGFNVIVHYQHSIDEAESLCAELNGIREQSAIALAADLVKIQDGEQLIARAVSKWGRLDALVNNASRFYKTLVCQVTDEEWDDLLTTNLKAPFFLAQAAAKYLAQQQGSIVNIADIHAEKPMRNYSVYCISKAGLVMMTQALAKELGPAVRVNAVAPGSVAWPEGDNALTSKDKDNILQRVVLQRHGSPDDIAKAVLYLIQDADYVTGQVLAVDGGRSLSM